MAAGAEAALAAMNKYQRQGVGMHTLRMVKRMMLNPEIAERINRRAEEIRAEALQVSARTLEGDCRASVRTGSQ